MESVGQKVGTILKTHGKAAAAELITEVLEVALKEAVAKTPNSIDDVLVAALYPNLKAELLKLIENA